MFTVMDSLTEVTDTPPISTLEKFRNELSKRESACTCRAMYTCSLLVV